MLTRALGEASIAARMLGAADALRDEIGGAPPIVQRGCVDRAERVARAKLDPAAYEAEHARGRADAHSPSSPAFCHANPCDVRM